MITTNQYLIGEFSKATGVSKRMLRHFDKLDLLSPNHIDVFNGYRYYDMEQLTTINKIKHLQEFGFTLKAIKSLLNEPLDFEEFLSLLRDQEAVLRNDTDQMVHHLLKLENFISYVEKNPHLEGDLQLEEFQIERNLPMTKYQIIKEEINVLPSSSIFYEKIKESCEEGIIKHVHFITFDTDKFMYINDDFGFDVGDKVIFTNYAFIRDSFSDILNKNQHNLLTRLGGDEFSLFIVNENSDLIKTKTKEALDHISQYDYSQVGCMRPVTASAGIAKVNTIVHPMEFRHQSTKALLNAKRNGRNQSTYIEV